MRGKKQPNKEVQQLIGILEKKMKTMDMKEW